MQILLILLNTVIPGSNFEATMSMAGYAKMLPVFKRSAMVSVIVPDGQNIR